MTSKQKRLSTLDKKTEANKKALIVEFEKTPIVSSACAKLSIGRSTYYEWLSKDKVFAKAVEQSKKYGISFINDMAESKLIQNIQGGSNTAIIFWLKYHNSIYRERFNRYDDDSSPIPEEISEKEEVAIVKALMNIGLDRMLITDQKIKEQAIKENNEAHEKDRVIPLIHKDKSGVKISDLLEKREGKF